MYCHQTQCFCHWKSTHSWAWDIHDVELALCPISITVLAMEVNGAVAVDLCVIVCYQCCVLHLGYLPLIWGPVRVCPFGHYLAKHSEWQRAAHRSRVDLHVKNAPNPVISTRKPYVDLCKYLLALLFIICNRGYRHHDSVVLQCFELIISCTVVWVIICINVVDLLCLSTLVTPELSPVPSCVPSWCVSWCSLWFLEAYPTPMA